MVRLACREARSSPRSVAARPAVPQVAVLCAGGELVVFDTRTGKEVYHDNTGEASVTARSPRVAYTADGATLVCLTAADTIHVYNAATGRPRDRVIRPGADGSGSCRTFALSPDSKLLATAVNGRNAARVWDLATGEPLSKPLPHPGDHYGLFCLVHGTFLVDGDGLVRWQDISYEPFTEPRFLLGEAKRLLKLPSGALLTGTSRSARSPKANDL